MSETVTRKDYCNSCHNLCKVYYVTCERYKGVPGPEGPIGYQGYQGLQGFQGYQGIDGSSTNTGATGSQGYQGFQGYQGPDGFQGTNGYQGFQGVNGIQGEIGTQGFQGTNGSQGFQGTQGEQGVQGFQGDQGFQGSQGFQGEPGPSNGPQGVRGFQGFQGVQGFQGNQGDQGFQGVQGFQGDQGYKGEIGIQGVQGNQGFQGYQGAIGIQGYQGFQGFQGYQGVPGPSSQIFLQQDTLNIADDSMQNIYRRGSILISKTSSKPLNNLCQFEVLDGPISLANTGILNLKDVPCLVSTSDNSSISGHRGTMFSSESCDLQDTGLMLDSLSSTIEYGSKYNKIIGSNECKIINSSQHSMIDSSHQSNILASTYSGIINSTNCQVIEECQNSYIQGCVSSQLDSSQQSNILGSIDCHGKNITRSTILSSNNCSMEQSSRCCILGSQNASMINQSNQVLIGTNCKSVDQLGPSLLIGSGDPLLLSSGNGIGIAAYIQTPGTIPLGIISANNFMTPAADYGEYFEWEDGNPGNEDRRGLFVTFSEMYPDKIKLAMSNDYILGVVTNHSGIMGNSYELGWHGTLSKDKFNQPLKQYNRYYDLYQFISKLGKDPSGKNENELVEMLRADGLAWGDFNDPTRNKPFMTVTHPSYNSLKEYIPRSKRPEWACVGLLGCLVVLENQPGTCIPGKYINCSNLGRGQPGDRYRVIKRIGLDTVSIYFRG